MNDFHTWLAEAIATHAHTGQVDKAGRPYIEHPRAVAAALDAAGHGPFAVQAGWLHDVVEDTDVTIDNLYDAGFNPFVVRAVESVTRRHRPGATPEPYFNMIHRAAAHPLGRLVKIADNRHNFGRLDHLQAQDREFLHKRYTRAYAILEAAAQRAGEEVS